MKLAFKFWGLTSIGYDKKLIRIFPYKFVTNRDIQGLAFINISTKNNTTPGMMQYNLKKLG